MNVLINKLAVTLASTPTHTYSNARSTLHCLRPILSKLYGDE